MILNKSQAEAVYSAMCALNNVSMLLDAVVSIGSTRVYENRGGNVVVDMRGVPTERYANQAAFATAYGLDHGGEDDSPASSYAGMFGTSGNTPRPEF